MDAGQANCELVATVTAWLADVQRQWGARSAHRSNAWRTHQCGTLMYFAMKDAMDTGHAAHPRLAADLAQEWSLRIAGEGGGSTQS